MRCPFCKHEDTAVIDTRMSEDGESVRRRRECEACDKRFTTYERVELAMPAVVKANGYRTAYDREKVRTGFMREKRDAEIHIALAQRHSIHHIGYGQRGQTYRDWYSDLGCRNGSLGQ